MQEIENITRAESNNQIQEGGTDYDEMQRQFQMQLRDFNQKQREIVQDDACCAICSSGDYEDDD